MAFILRIGLSIFLFTLSSPVWAAVDLSLGGYARSAPLSGVLETELGLSYRIWGHGAKVGESAAFGYVRVFGGYSWLPDYNAKFGGVEVFPIALLGLRAMTNAIKNDRDLKDYPCDDYLCEGEFREDRLQVSLLIPIQKIFIGALNSEDSITSYGVNRSGMTADLEEMILPTSGLAARNGMDDTLMRQVYYVGYKFNDQWKTVAQTVNWEVDSNGLQSSQNCLFIGYSHKSGVQLNLGAGRFQSDLEDRSEFTAVGSLIWNVLPKDGYL